SSMHLLCYAVFFLHSYCVHRFLHSFPTRRSSDLFNELVEYGLGVEVYDPILDADDVVCKYPRLNLNTSLTINSEDALISPSGKLDRKSTRLNSSHVKISYAVFCLKNKTQNRRGIG